MRTLFAAAFIAAFAAGIVLGFSVAGLREPANPDGAAKVFWVEPHEPLEPVAKRLAAEGLLPERAFFGPDVLVVYAKWSGKDRAIKSGEYDLSPALTPLQILDKLVAGKVKMHEVTVPEGLRLDEVAARLESAGITSAAAFEARARDPELAHSLGVEADSFEGYAYPETYRFRRDTPPEEILAGMVEELRHRLGPDEQAALERSGMTLHQLVTLASIVEKESTPGPERGLISAVFHNRLAKGMRLQSDPTVIYGIVQTRGGFDGNIRLADLREDTPWNTYTRAGLPPGPIASPSLDAIRATLHPADVDYLYFVARNDGTHAFSATLADHNRAVKRFQTRKQAKNEVGTEHGEHR
jgi:UPF0755 protein